MSTRDLILAYLKEYPYQEFTQQELTEYLDKNKSTVSRAIKSLTEAGLVTVRKQTVGTVHTNLVRLNPETEDSTAGGSQTLDHDTPSVPVEPPVTTAPVPTTVEVMPPIDAVGPEPPVLVEQPDLSPVMDLIQQQSTAIQNLTQLLNKQPWHQDHLAHAPRGKVTNDLLRHIIEDLSGVRVRWLNNAEMKDLIKRLLEDPNIDVIELNTKHRLAKQKQDETMFA